MTRSASPRRSREHLALALDPVEQPAAALQRVRAAGGLLAAHQHVVGGLEEQQRRVRAVRAAGRGWPRRSSKNAPDRTSTTTAIRAARAAARRRPARRRRAAARAAGCRPRTSRGPPAPWRRCSARRRSCRCTMTSSPGGSGRPRSSLPVGSASSLDLACGRVDGRRRPSGRLRRDQPSDRRTPPCARPKPGNCGDLVDGGRAQLLQRAEVPQQRLAAHLAEAGDVVEQALDHRLRAPVAVVGDREPVRLVAHALQQVEALAGAGQDDRVLLARAARPPPAAWPGRRPGCRRCRARRGRAARPRPAADRRRRRPGPGA